MLIRPALNFPTVHPPLCLPAFVFRYIQSLLISPGELSGQVLSFAANTIYMAISCSNLQPKTELSGSSSTGKLAVLYSVY